MRYNSNSYELDETSINSNDCKFIKRLNIYERVKYCVQSKMNNFPAIS